ncbi:MAG TPA: non-homologous end-joining DNA ligase [Acidimicrobiales bacterium]|nr:non-homologous end-joining DNA ligase [Acidimicrobiales bacterium]
MSKSSSVEVEVEGRRLTVSNLDKPLYPGGFTKGQMIDYYVRIAPVMLGHVRDRPLTLHRYPNGVHASSFFEKHVPSHAPDWVRTVEVPSTATGSRGRSASESVEYAVVCDVATLAWAANLATIELHVPLWRVARRRTLPGPPDHMVFDLDPGEGSTMVDCCRVARLIDDALPDRTTYPKTSGSKGLQLYTRLSGRPTWDRVRDEALELARTLEGEHADLVVSNMRKELRRGKVLIDWSQNHPAKTTVAVYSLRARDEPTVSTPVSWDEVNRCIAAEDPGLLRFTSDQVLDRVEDHGDLFEALAR